MDIIYFKAAQSKARCMHPNKDIAMKPKHECSLLIFYQLNSWQIQNKNFQTANGT